MKWYLGVLKKYAVFSGRARRKEHWYFLLFNFIVQLLLMVIDYSIGTFLVAIYCLAVAIPCIAVTVRRLHDTGRSGWWLLISLVPVIGGIALLIFSLQDSKPGENQYGPNPKAEAT
jgi:Predicted membrane protein